MSESEYLESQCDGGAEEDYRERQQQKYFDNIEVMKARYTDNKQSQVGTTIRCTTCGMRIIKSNYQTQFCSNKGHGNCKDKYWNCSTDKRLFRSQLINR